MHKYYFRSFYFINKFDPNHIAKLDKNVTIIYRNYLKKLDEKLIIKIKNYCKKKGKKLYLSNNPKIALKLNLDGVYLPSFNKSLSILNFRIKKGFDIIGSAHNLKEIRTKENQKVKTIFISSIFKKNNNYLGINKFKNISKLTSLNIIALGGINKKNFKKLHQLNIQGFASISFFQK